jgi:valyl-tRNA synthetase
MILMSGYLLGEVPFKTVYMHGLVRDEKGRKMSKSLGNIVDPVELIQKYGADSLRMALIVGNGPGNDLNLSEDKIRAYRKFSNKLWNIARFVLESIDGADAATLSRSESPEGLHAEWIAEFQAIAKDVTSDLDNFRYYLASEKLYHYVWHTFADKLIEESKPMLALDAENAAQRATTQATLLYLLRSSLTLLHPFMPFITEEIWSHIPPTAAGKKSLIISRWLA